MNLARVSSENESRLLCVAENLLFLVAAWIAAVHNNVNKWCHLQKPCGTLEMHCHQRVRAEGRFTKQGKKQMMLDILKEERFVFLSRSDMKAWKWNTSALGLHRDSLFLPKTVSPKVVHYAPTPLPKKEDCTFNSRYTRWRLEESSGIYQGLHR